MVRSGSSKAIELVAVDDGEFGEREKGDPGLCENIVRLTF